MEEENNNYESLPGDDHVESSDGAESVSDETTTEPTAENVDSLSLKEMNEYLGKNFTDKSKALEAIKETFNYVGKKREQVKEELSKEGGFVSKKDFEQAMFYTKNPQYESPEIRAVLEGLAASKGVGVAEVANSEEFKGVYAKISGFDENQKAKSVLSSNPRLGQVKSKMTEAEEIRAKALEANKVGDTPTAGRLNDAAQAKIAESVIEAFDL